MSNPTVISLLIATACVQAVVAAYAPVALPFALDALQPSISSVTMDTHYNKHYKNYINTLNTLSANQTWAGKSIPELVASLPAGKPYNNAGQALNHEQCWTSLSATGGIASQPTSGDLFTAIVRDFGSMAAFLTQFNTTSAGHFGSGWVFLILTPDAKLKVVDTDNAGSPLSSHVDPASQGVPLLTFDVWEHAYYLDQKNLRQNYINAFLTSLLNWEDVATRYQAATQVTCTQYDTTCQMPVKGGGSQQWGYDANSGSCVQFSYNGCGMHWDSETACLSTCIHREKKQPQPTPSQPVCTPYVPMMKCGGSNVTKFAFDQTLQICKAVQYYPNCRSNNVYDTWAQCDQNCPNNCQQQQQNPCPPCGKTSYCAKAGSSQCHTMQCGSSCIKYWNSNGSMITEEECSL